MREWLKRARAGANLTQEQLSREIGVSCFSVQNWEAGRSKPRRRDQEALAKVLKCPDIVANFESEPVVA